MEGNDICRLESRGEGEETAGAGEKLMYEMV